MKLNENETYQIKGKQEPIGLKGFVLKRRDFRKKRTSILNVKVDKFEIRSRFRIMKMQVKKGSKN